MSDIKYYTITDHTKLKECLYNSSVKYCCWFPWYRRQQQTHNNIKSFIQCPIFWFSTKTKFVLYKHNSLNLRLIFNN
jgi:hypothetical protein